MRWGEGRDGGRIPSLKAVCRSACCSETSSDVTALEMLLNPPEGVSKTLYVQIHHLLSGVWEGRVQRNHRSGKKGGDSGYDSNGLYQALMV